MAGISALNLTEELAAVLPLDHKFIIHHISTPPTKCDAIYSAPPNTRPDRTYRESHFLQISIPTISSNDSTSVFVLAIECLIYTTRHLTTIFVSKADSTGYLANLNLGRQWDSPLRSVATTFVGYLVKHRMRPGIKLVVDLFARASDQYLYPGSVENATKHVSDDRQLVKWWCRVLNPIVQSYALKEQSGSIFNKTLSPRSSQEEAKTTGQAYLLVPGEDLITNFLPPLVRLNVQARLRWAHGHPLASLSRHAAAPPRSLIPHFPDDPKGRYLIELDDELPDANSANSSSQDASPSKRGNGEWKSVKSLDRFWEMMAFRSECSSGRLVGFIWIVFEPPGPAGLEQETQDSQESIASNTISSQQHDKVTPKKSSKKQQMKAGKIPALLPRILRTNSSDIESVPTSTPWFIWPRESRAKLVLSDTAYTKATEVLLRLDFANLNVATQSTRAWVGEVAVLAGISTKTDEDWGDVVTGQAVPKQVVSSDAAVAVGGQTQTSNNQAAVNIMMGVKRKRPEQQNGNGDGGDVSMTNATTTAPPAEAGQTPAVNVLGVRKKPKKVQPATITSL